MIYHEFGYKNCSGAELFACSWEAKGRSSVNVLLIHGLGEHVGRYQVVAEFLVDQGYNVYAFDQVGFGKSPGKRGHVSSFDVYFRDIHRFVQIIKDPWNRHKTVILGHSMGGLLSLAYGIKYPNQVDGYIISSPALKNYPVPKNLEFFLKIFNRVVPWISLRNSLPADKLSHNSKVVEAYMADPLVHDKVTPRFVSELIKVIDFTQANAHLFQEPLLMLYAGQDQIVDPEGVKEFVSKLGTEVPKEIICYEDMYHEIFNEANREVVLTKINHWLGQLTRDQVVNS